MTDMKIGIIGTGNIGPAYIKGCGKFPDVIDVVACADIVEAKAQAFAQAHNLQAYTITEMLAHDDIDLIINLTIPSAHAEVSHQILDSGKHVYVEKPLALNVHDGHTLLKKAHAHGLRIGCAPDTFLGAGGQTARQVIDRGDIGKPVAATAFMVGHGHEGWHPNPSFYYQPGGGPMFDMGPYYLTALVNLLGSIDTVSGMAGRAFATRTAENESIRGQEIPVDVDTHITGTLRFHGGCIATIIMSFDVWQHQLPCIEIYGTEGSLIVPDPNTFGGKVMLWQRQNQEWIHVDSVGRSDVQRGIGVADMARAIQTDEPHRASGELALHVLEAMQSFDDSSTSGKHITLKHPSKRPDPLK